MLGALPEMLLQFFWCLLVSSFELHFFVSVRVNSRVFYDLTCFIRIIGIVDRGSIFCFMLDGY